MLHVLLESSPRRARHLGVVSASHPAFVPAVKDALLRSRFLPAQIGDRPVRQLVEQRLVFAIR